MSGPDARYRVLRGTVAQRIEVGRPRQPLLVELVLSIDDVRDLGVQLDNRLLQALACRVARSGQCLVVFQQQPLFVGETQRGVDVRQLVERLLDLSDDVAPLRLMEVVLRRRLLEARPGRADRACRSTESPWLSVTAFVCGPTRVSRLRSPCVKLRTGSGSAVTCGTRSRAAR